VQWAASASSAAPRFGQRSASASSCAVVAKLKWYTPKNHFFVVRHKDDCQDNPLVLVTLGHALVMCWRVTARSFDDRSFHKSRIYRQATKSRLNRLASMAPIPLPSVVII
jgi:hypothetical protein